MTDNRLRVLFFDDAPNFIETQSGLLSFAVGSGIDGAEVLARNFQLRWLYSGEQAKQYATRLRVAMRESPAQLAEKVGYPNILMFDYDMQHSRRTERDLRTMQSLESYLDRLSPLNGNWGKQYALLGREPGEVEREFTTEQNPEQIKFQGCIAGVDISSMLGGFAHVGIPQTAHLRPEGTAGLEWHHSPHLGPLFERKTGTLEDWFVLFAKALPALRHQLTIGFGSGLIAPRISDLLSLVDHGVTPETDKEIAVSSQLGEEHFRLEALFFDQFFALSEEEELVVAAADDAARIVKDWARNALAAASGAKSDVSGALTLASKFIAAHSDPMHCARRWLSREFHAAGSADYETVVEQNSDLLRLLEVPPEAALDSLQGGKGLSNLKVGINAQAKIGALAHLHQEAENNPELARLAALALLVWGEMAWRGATSDDVGDTLYDLGLAFENGGLVGDALEARLRKIAGIVIPEDALETFLASNGDLNARRKFTKTLATRSTYFGSLEPLHDFFDNPLTVDEDGDAKVGGAQLVSQSVEARTTFVRYLFEPAPARLLMWQETPKAKENIDSNLRRIGADDASMAVKITEILKGEANFRPGEGQLLRLFAFEFGFAERHWPSWMQEACKL